MADKKNDDSGAMAGNVDQIREIIFGGHIKDYDKRFAALEKSLNDAQARLAKDFAAQLKELKQSLDATQGALEQEAVDRQNADEGLDGLLQSQGGDLGKEMNAAEKRLDSRVDELTAALSAAQKALANELKKQGTAFNRDLGKVTDRLEDHKVARTELATLLTGVATQLTGDKTAKPKRK